MDCKTCKGTGHIEFERGAVVKNCPHCKGTGSAKFIALCDALITPIIKERNEARAERDALRAQVESFTEKGSVQIYPGSALEPCEEPGECVAVPVEPHNIAQQVREALDRKACPDAWMVVAYEATVRAILAQQGKED